MNEKLSLRLAFLIDSLTNLGGYQVFTNNLVLRLLDRGHAITVYVFPSKYRKHRNYYNSLPYQVLPATFCSRPLIRHAPFLPQAMLLREQLRHGYDLWQTIGAYPPAYLTSMLLGRVPVAVRCYGQDIQIDHELGYGERLDPRIDARVRQTLPRLDRLVAISPTVAEEFRGLDIPEDKVRIIPNGVEINATAPDVSTLNSLRAELNLGTDTFVLLTVGRNHPKKNFKVIPGIAHLLRQAGLDFVWLLVGPDMEKLADEIKRLGLDDRFKLLGVVQPEISEAGKNFSNPRMDTLYQLADAFIFPTKLETQGRVIIEALANSLPVVTTPAPGSRDIIVDNMNGLVCDPDDIDCFARKILLLTNNNDLRNSLTQSGLLEARKYSWPTIVAAYENMYFDAVEASRKR